MIPRTQRHDFLSGLVFSVVGLAFAWGANAHPVGTAARMGAGYFPMMVGIALTVIGAVISIRAVWRDQRGRKRLAAPNAASEARQDGSSMRPSQWRPLVFVLGANLVFGALLVGVPSVGIPSMGMLVAVPALVITASLAQAKVHWRQVAWLCLVLTLGSYLIFVRLLNLQIPVLPRFMLG